MTDAEELAIRLEEVELAIRYIVEKEENSRENLGLSSILEGVAAKINGIRRELNDPDLG